MSENLNRLTPEETTEYMTALGLVRYLQRGMDALGGHIDVLEGENQELCHDVASLTAAKGDLSAENAE